MKKSCLHPELCVPHKTVGGRRPANFKNLICLSFIIMVVIHFSHYDNAAFLSFKPTYYFNTNYYDICSTLISFYFRIDSFN